MFGSSFSITSLHFPISLSIFHISLSLSLSLSLSVVNMCMCKRQYQQKKALTEAADHYKFAYLWASLVIPQHKYSKFDFFFLFSFRAKGK